MYMIQLVVIVTWVLMTAVGISLLREGGSRSSNSFQITNNFKGPFRGCLLSETENVCHRRGSYRTLPSKH